MGFIRAANEQFAPMVGLDIEAYDPTTGRVVQIARTSTSGVATFGDLPDNTQYRPRATRRSGSAGAMPMGGAIHLDTRDASKPVGAAAGAGFNLPTPELIFKSAPKQITAGGTTTAITVQRVDEKGSALTGGNLTVYLYTSSPTGTIPATITIINGQSTATFTYTDTTGGNPVLTASTKALI